MEQIKRFIGVCPQEDKLYEDLSVRQHLVFYSLLRGLPRSRIDVEARRLAEKVGLDGDAFNKAASTLSGGAKRRLSIAIALAGKPPVLFFGTCKPLPLRLLPKVQQRVRRRADDGIGSGDTATDLAHHQVRAARQRHRHHHRAPHRQPA